MLKIEEMLCDLKESIDMAHNAYHSQQYLRVSYALGNITGVAIKTQNLLVEKLNVQEKNKEKSQESQIEKTG